MKLIIKDDEDRKTVVPLVRDEISIGRQEGNTIRLTDRNVSRKHARLLRQNGSIYVEDLGSYNGVKVNGDRIEARQAVREGDSIEIGDYLLEVEGAPGVGDGDTNPTNGHVEPSNRTPTLAQPQPQQRAPATAPMAPAVAPAPPAARKTDANATAVIRLSDLGKPADDEQRDLGANEQPRIVCLAGNLRGTEHKLKRSVVKFGRTDDGNDLVIDHQSISRTHGRFQLEADGWKLYDNKSANGIRVNGDEYGMSPVKPGDTIELGHVKFRFVAPGEQFTLPREAPQAAASAPAGDRADAPPAKSKTPLFIGIGAVVLVAVVAVVVLALPKGPKGPDPKENCLKAQAAVGTKDWSGAITALGMAQSLNVQCEFDVGAQLQQAQSEKKVKELLEEAQLYIDDGKFRQSLKILESVPADSTYSAEAKLKAVEVRRDGVRKYTDEAQRAIDKGRADEAGQFVDDIEALDRENPVVQLLRGKLVALKQKQAAPPPPTKKPLEERNKAAETLIADGLKKVRAGDVDGGIANLKNALEEDPETALKAKAARNLGISYARKGDTASAVKFYKLYLQFDPNSAEAPKIRQIIAQQGG